METYIVKNKKLFSKSTGKEIGNISPEALGYVKEGDEFDEDEILVALNNESGDPDDDFCRLTDIRVVPLEEGEYILVKGPCGYFH